MKGQGIIDEHMRGEALAFLEAAYNLESETIGIININSEFTILYKGNFIHLFNVDLLGEPTVVEITISIEEMAKPYAERRNFKGFQGSAGIVLEEIFPTIKKTEIGEKEIYKLPKGVRIDGQPLKELYIDEEWQLGAEFQKTFLDHPIEELAEPEKVEKSSNVEDSTPKPTELIIKPTEANTDVENIPFHNRVGNSEITDYKAIKYADKKANED